MTPIEPAPLPAKAEQSLTRHGAGFVVSGVIAMAVDGGVTSLLTRGWGLSAFIARPVAIALAMVVAWICHRRLTFAITTAPTVGEFARYAAVAWGAAAVNYMVYAGILIADPSLAPEAVLVMATIVSMIVTYVGMRFGVFVRPDAKT